MELIKHTIENHTIPTDKELLVLIEVNNNYLWAIGTYLKNFGWVLLQYDYTEYNIIEWYELPIRNKTNNEYSNHQKQLEDFWYEK